MTAWQIFLLTSITAGTKVAESGTTLTHYLVDADTLALFTRLINTPAKTIVSAGITGLVAYTTSTDLTSTDNGKYLVAVETDSLGRLLWISYCKVSMDPIAIAAGGS